MLARFTNPWTGVALVGFKPRQGPSQFGRDKGSKRSTRQEEFPGCQLSEIGGGPSGAQEHGNEEGLREAVPRCRFNCVGRYFRCWRKKASVRFQASAAPALL